MIPEWLPPTLGLGFLAVYAIVKMRKRERIVGRVHEVAVAEGLENPRAHSARWSGIEMGTWSGVEATWRGRAVRFRWIPGRRGVPPHVVIWIRFEGPSRIVVRWRDSMLLWITGPPKVEHASTSLVIRADDAAAATRVVRTPAVQEALLVMFEELRVDRKGVRVTVPIYKVESTNEAVSNGWKLAEAVANVVGSAIIGENSWGG
jgi:hypothetical protein